ncbi:MAG: pyridoxal-phosphate dependent enzyme [Niabella sp.]
MNFVHEDLITTDPVPLLSKNGIETAVLRLDKIHPVISGNKWFKLRFYIQEALQQHKKTILTFGGAYSNHIAATAAACYACGLKSIGIIRGEAPARYSHTLLAAKEHGMQLHFVSREKYRLKEVPEIIEEEYYLVPEGGYGFTGANGAATIPYQKNRFDIICCAVGTGTMLAGLLNGKSPGAAVWGFSVLKGYTTLEEEVKYLLKPPGTQVKIYHDFHFGGYAKHTPALLDFMNKLYASSNIPTDFVYTGKLFFGVNQLIEKNIFPANSKVLIIHSGGLQGNQSLRKGTLIF